MAHIPGVLRRHPGKVTAALAAVVMAGCIVGNAVLFQTGRHPAPLFGHGPTATALPVPATRPAAVVAPPRLSGPLPTKPIEAAAPTSSEGPTAVRPMKVKAAASPNPDALGQFLRDADKPAALRPDVAAAQRALARLGAAVKPTGHMDKATRAALDKFALDHHLPKGGEVSPTLLRALEAAARHPGVIATSTRLRSDFWVSAYLRLCAAQGAVAVLRRRGAAEAGAIFIKVDRLDGSARLLGPTPQSDADPDGERRFVSVLKAEVSDGADVEARLRREIAFDSDLWIVEVEDRAGRAFLPGTTA